MTNEELNKLLKNTQHCDSDAKVIELDDTIKFNCKRCGKCCSHRSDIIINPFDVYKIAKGLNITTKEVIENYCVVHIGINSCLPIVTLDEDERGLCPFLKLSISEGKFNCSINDFKPGACIMHPIGVIRGVDKKTNIMSTQFIEVSSCKVHGTDTEVKVRDFIKPYLDNNECHEAGLLLAQEPLNYINTNKFIKCFVEHDQTELENNFSEDEIKKIKSINYNLVQISYQIYIGQTIMAMYNLDTSRDFMEQVDERKAAIKENCLKMITTFRLLDVDFSSGTLTEEDEEEISRISKDFEQGFEQFCKEMDEKGEE